LIAIAGQPVARPQTGAGSRTDGNVLVRRLGWTAAFCTLTAVVLGLLGFADIVDGPMAWPMATAFIVLAALGGVAALAAHRAQGALLGRLDLFGQALEASPDAQLVLGPDRAIAYANAAFHGLFPGLSTAPLEAIAGRLESGGRSQEEFRRLISHATSGRHAVAALSIREPHVASGWFHG